MLATVQNDHPSLMGLKSAITKVQEKGQVTIPVAFRKLLGVDKGARVQFALNEEGEVTIKPVSVSAVRTAVSSISQYLEENDISLEELDAIVDSVQDRIFEEMYGDL